MLATLAACSGENHPPVIFKTTDITGVDWGKDFRLADHNGVARTLSDFRGKAVMMFFGYTNCPDMCPVTLAKMSQAENRLGADSSRVQGLFITVDPKRDTQVVLANYVPSFHPTFLGLRGSEAETASATKDFKVFFAAQKNNDAEHYSVDHNGAIFVFDPSGRLRLFMSGETDVEAIVHDVKALLNE